MRFKPLAIQVLQQVLLYALLFWLLVSVTRAGLTYYQGQQRLQQVANNVAELYLPFMEESVLAQDSQGIQKMLTTICALPGVEAARLDTTTGLHQQYIRTAKPLENHSVFKLKVPRSHTSDSLATLTLQLSHAPIRQQILSELFSNMLQRVLDFSALALLLVVILRQRLVLPLQQLANTVRSFRPGETLPPLRLHQPAGYHDEITQLIESFQTLRSSINSHLLERMRHEKELLTSQFLLTRNVQERTKELDQLLCFQTLISAISSRFINIPLEEVDLAMQEALAEIGPVMQVDRCYLVGLDKMQLVSMVHEWTQAGIAAGKDGLDFAPLTARPALYARLMRDGVLNLPDCRQATGETLDSTSRQQSVLMIRIDYQGKPVGIFGCDMEQSSRVWQDKELIQARLLGEMFASMIMRSQQLQALEDTQKKLHAANTHLARMALSDSLTGLANRRHFDEEKRQIFDMAIRKNEPLSVIFLDIDYFKEYNDHYGHQAGDSCLQKLAAVLAAMSAYPGELAARIGGEEFAILLPGLDQNSANQRAESLRQAVYHLQIEHSRSQAEEVITVSQGGVTLDPSRHQSIDQLIAEADAALYRAKASGRHCVCWAGAQTTPPLPSG
jgi:diguanylate cyclase (GGDEF)-like protein